jgi:hypothetical protein
MYNQPDFFIYNQKNYDDKKLITRNKQNTNWNIRKTLQNQHLEPMLKTKQSQTPNVPHLYKSSYDNNHPRIGNNMSDLKRFFINNEQFQFRLISPSININKVRRFN